MSRHALTVSLDADMRTDFIETSHLLGGQPGKIDRFGAGLVWFGLTDGCRSHNR